MALLILYSFSHTIPQATVMTIIMSVMVRILFILLNYASNVE